MNKTDRVTAQRVQMRFRYCCEYRWGAAEGCWPHMPH